MDITIVTTAVDNAQGRALLDAFGFPFKRGAEAAIAPKKQNTRGPQYAAKKKK